MKAKRLILFLIFISPALNRLPAMAAAPYSLTDSAAAAYNKGNYAGAIAFYNRFLKSGYVSADVYYNLGNCYYRTNDIAKAILNYERAKKITPSDADLQFNLQLANLKTTDKIPGETQLIINTWWTNFINLEGERGWAYFSILFLCLALMLLLLYLFSGRLAFRQAGFWGAVLMFAACTAAFMLAREQYRTLTTHSTAIVMSPSVTVKASPADNGTALFVIHDGTKVTIVKTEGAWTEIKLSNGNQGWLLNTDIEAI